MLIAGAKGLAKQLLGVIINSEFHIGLVFYDKNPEVKNFYGFQVWNDLENVSNHFESDPRFNLGVGNPRIRKLVFDQMVSAGGQIQSLISPKAVISEDVRLASGVSILTHAIVENGCSIGVGTLINLAALICHDTRVGDFCEISPSAILLGESSVGDGSFIGAGAIINPGIKVGRNCLVASGAVVIADVPDNTMVAGVPAQRKSSG
jgi:sugar O-acyltransferase (sialic acid O-acetyltransferase NeuD family)